jgi:hypothetical protein
LRTDDIGSDKLLEDSRDETCAEATDHESLIPDHLGTSVSDIETEPAPSLDDEDPCEQLQLNLRDDCDQVQPDGGTSTTEEVANSCSRAGEGVFGLCGGETNQNMGARYDDNERRPSGEIDGGQAISTSFRETSGSNSAGSDMFRNGHSEEKDELHTSLERPHQDTNPHRVSADGALVKTWERRLSMLTSAVDIPGQDPQASNVPPGTDQLYSFANEPDVDGTECETQNEKHALGPATEEQQRPLPDQAIAEVGERPEIERGRRDTFEQSQKFVARQRAPRLGAAISFSDEAREDRAEKQSLDDDLKTSRDRQAHTNASAAEMAVEAAESMAQQALSRAAITGGIAHVRMNVDRTAADIKEQSPDAREDHAREGHANEVKSELVAGLRAANGAKLWRRLEYLTMLNAQSLCEQLRLVLEPTVATGLSGDFRSGKRLNMRRVVDFVASDFRRDRIWLRRVRPEKRSYDVLIAIDDSESMAESGAGPVALEALALLTSALSKLEVGRVAVVTFGTEPKLVRSFEEPLPIDDCGGARMLQNFTFAQKNTNVKCLLDFMNTQLNGSGSLSVGATGEEVRLAFIISDGRLSERAEVRRRICELHSSRVLVAFILIDSPVGGRKSIFDVQRVEYEPNGSGSVSVTPYMDKFPVEFYAVVRDVSALPTVLADALRQWFEAVNS